MKDVADSTAVGRAPEPESFTSRKLIRPPFAAGTRDGARPDAVERRERNGSAGKKVSPPEQTHAENFYYQKQIQTKTPLVIVRRNGDTVHGVLEWYDRCCLKLNRNGGQSNLLIYKHAIKYMYKESETVK
jgi:host factor-I protein